VAARVPDGTIEHDLALAAHTQRDRRIEAAAVEALNPRPDVLDATRRHAHRPEVAGHPDAAQRVGHQWKARDRRDRNVLQRDHRRDALPVSTISAATWSASR